MQSADNYVLDLLLNGKKGLHVTDKYNQLKQFSRKNSEPSLPYKWIDLLLTRYIQNSLLKFKHNNITTPNQVYEQVPFAKLSHDMQHAWAQNYYYYFDDHDTSNALPAEILENIDFAKGYMDMCEKLTTIQYIWEALYKNDTNLQKTTSMYEAFKRKGNTNDSLQISLALILSRIFRAQFCHYPPSNIELESEMMKLVVALEVDFPYIFQELQDRGKQIFEQLTTREYIQRMMLPLIPAATFIIPLAMDHIFSKSSTIQNHHNTMSAVFFALLNAHMMSQIQHVDLLQKIMLCMNFLADTTYYYKYSMDPNPSILIFTLYIAIHYFLMLLLLCTPANRPLSKTNAVLLFLAPLAPFLSFYISLSQYYQANQDGILFIRMADAIWTNENQTQKNKTVFVPQSFLSALAAPAESLQYALKEYTPRMKKNLLLTGTGKVNSELYNIWNQYNLEWDSKPYIMTWGGFLLQIMIQRAREGISFTSSLDTLFANFCQKFNIQFPIGTLTDPITRLPIVLEYTKYLFLELTSSTQREPFVRLVDNVNFETTQKYSNLMNDYAHVIVKHLPSYDVNQTIAYWLGNISRSNIQMLTDRIPPVLIKMPHISLLKKKEKNLHHMVISKQEVEKLTDQACDILRTQLSTFYPRTTPIQLPPIPITPDTGIQYFLPAILLSLTSHGHRLMDEIHDSFQSTSLNTFFFNHDSKIPASVLSAYSLACLMLPNKFILNFLLNIHKRISDETRAHTFRHLPASHSYIEIHFKTMRTFSPAFVMVRDILVNNMQSQKLVLEILGMSYKARHMQVKGIASLQHLRKDNLQLLRQTSIETFCHFWLPSEVNSKQRALEDLFRMAQRRAAFAAYNAVLPFPTPNNILVLLNQEYADLLPNFYKANPDIFPSMLLQAIAQTALLRSWLNISNPNGLYVQHDDVNTITAQIKAKEKQIQQIFNVGTTILKINKKLMKNIEDFLFDYFQLYDASTAADIIPDDQKEDSRTGILYQENEWMTVDPQFYKDSKKEMFENLDAGNITLSTPILHSVFQTAFDQYREALHL